MPKTPAKAEINSFTGGLVTEASGLNFPPNASPDVINFDFNTDGSISRRLGFDFEPNFDTFAPPSGANNIFPPEPVTFKWTNVAGISDFTDLVVQFDNSLILFDLDTQSLSRDGILDSITLTDFPKDVRYSFGAVDGKLVIAAGKADIGVLTYSSGVFSVNYGRLKTRDFWGIEGTDPEGQKYERDPLFRGTILSPAHIYNLQNQSWGTLKTRDTDGAEGDPINHYKNVLSIYPSNSEQVWLGLQFKADTSGNPSERYYPIMSRDLFGTTSKAARGYFIIDVINRGSSRIQAVSDNNIRNYSNLIAYDPPNLPDYTDGGATCVAEFAGRIFYSGFTGETIGGDARSPVLSNYVFFSQLVRNVPDLFKCYQEGDPTSRDDSDIVDTDGGFVRISGADRILGMVPIGSKLIIICSNGVWSITGGSDYGFSATNYMVDKISSYGCLSPSSIVESKGRVFFWGQEGIFVAAKSQLGDIEVVNLSKVAIDDYYLNIPVFSKISSVGVNDSTSGKIRWIFSEEDNEDSNELVFDTNLNCFYPYKVTGIVGNKTLKIVGAFSTTPFSAISQEEEVFSVSDLVLSSSEPVVISSRIVDTFLTSVKYLVRITEAGVNSYTFGYYRNTDFRDWELVDSSGVDSPGYCQTGPAVVGDSSIRKQIQYLTTHFKRTEILDGDEYINQSSCNLFSIWDWSSSAASLKWSDNRQVYRHSKPQDITNFDVVTSRNLIRGQGRALSLRFETVPYSNCHIIGWSLAVDGNNKT